MALLGFIPVRIGSKGIPKKNIRNFCGKPLVCWTIEALLESDLDKVVVASDSEEINDLIKHYPIEIFNRSEDNATDKSTTEDVMFEYINNSGTYRADKFILAQATNPFITKTDVNNVIDAVNKGYSALTVVPVERFLWSEQGHSINYDPKERPRRQNESLNRTENGALYANSVSNIINSRCRIEDKPYLVEMPEYSLHEIDTEDDWDICEMLFKKHMMTRKKIKMFITDVDGVLTDGGMYYGVSGDALKKFNAKDGMGFGLLKEADIATAIITGEEHKSVSTRANKIRVGWTARGVKDKLAKAIELSGYYDVSLSEVAYIGDDINDIDLLKNVGYSACPSDAIDEVKDIVGYVCKRKGGEGCVREFIDRCLRN